MNTFLRVIAILASIAAIIGACFGQGVSLTSRILWPLISLIWIMNAWFWQHRYEAIEKQFTAFVKEKRDAH